MTDQTDTEVDPYRWPEETVEAVRAAEAAAQRSVVAFPDGETPEALTQALERRVEVNLAQHDGRTVRRVGSTDAQVRELEGPFLVRRSRAEVLAAEQPAKPAKKTSARKRAAKKTAAKAAADTPNEKE